ncbi:MAG: CoA ester lyase [Euryarchaeota archaeon]|nr:CoA ester lyase [Euryarchaeota archaeon]
MTETYQLKRSVMYTPASRLDRVQKALAAGQADVVVADLEDGTAPADKAKAREELARFLKSPPASRSLLAVRINVVPGPTGQADIAALRAHPPKVLVLPKVESLEAVRQAEVFLGEKAHDTKFYAQIETAKGLLHAHEIATNARVEALVFGAEDYAANVGAIRSDEATEILYARSHIVACAAAAKVEAIDMITADYQDIEACRRDARFGARLGYAGKQIIHPDQVAPTHEAFMPTGPELEYAKRVVEASAKVGGGVAVVDGKMIDRPLVEQAKRAIKRASR